MGKPRKIDYSLLEADWAAGIKNPRQMAAEFEATTGVKISHVAIIKHFEKIGMPRDLKGKIRARAEELVNKQLTEGEIRLTPLTEKRTIEVAARNAADILLSQRSDIREAQELFKHLLGELKVQTMSQADFEKLGELMFTPDDKGVDKLNELYRKVIATPSRISSFKSLTEACKNLIGLERQAFGLADNANGEADAPKAPALSPEDAARRVAFLLMQASQKG